MILMWSGNYVAAKIALREFPPVLLMGVRAVMAGALMLPIFVGRVIVFRDLPAPRHFPRLITMGVFGVALNQLLFTIGVSRTTVAHSALMVGMTPILVLLIAVALRMEKMTLAKVSGMFLALVGVTILQSGRSPQDGHGPTLAGDLITLAGALTFAIFTVMGKQSSRQFDAITVNTFAYVGAAILLAPATIYQARQVPLTSISKDAWACVAYMAIFSSVLCYFIYYFALRRIAASRVAAFSYLQPVFATLMAAAWLAEQITATVVTGGVVIFAGVVIAERG